MANLSFIHSLPSELTDFYLIPPNNRYPCDWGYNRVEEDKRVYHIIQAIGGAQYVFIVTDNDYNYWGHSDKFSEANKLGQDYGQPKQVEQATQNSIPADADRNDSLTTIPVSDSSQLFEDRYSICCHDPFSYHPVSNELVIQLAKDLGATNPVIVTTEMEGGRKGKYLTADSFLIIQNLIGKKEDDKNYLAEGSSGAYLLDISDTHFYHGYPKLFWKDYKFDNSISSEDEWGEVCYTNPILFERFLR